jgi:uncharacterized membrane protein YgcG
MKCPRCGLEVSDEVPRCGGCDFAIADLDAACGAPPARDGVVIDGAKKLSEAEHTALTEQLAALAKEVPGEIVVVTTERAPVKPAQYAFWLFNRWQVGGEAHAGLLVLLSFADRRVECEVGYGWEDTLDEVQTGELLDDAVVPLLADGKVAQALAAGVDRIGQRLRAGPAPQADA